MNIDEKMLGKAEVKRGVLNKLFQYASRGAVLAEGQEEPVDNDSDSESVVESPAPLVAAAGDEDPSH